jgi:hypothetical protein
MKNKLFVFKLPRGKLAACTLYTSTLDARACASWT